MDIDIEFQRYLNPKRKSRRVIIVISITIEGNSSLSGLTRVYLKFFFYKQQKNLQFYITGTISNSKFVGCNLKEFALNFTAKS